MSDIKKVHFIGIGGVGMSATAKLLRDNGVAVTGSDEAVYPPISEFLEAEDMTYRTPYSAENVPDDCDCIVIGKNAKLVPETNDEVRYAYDLGVPILSFPEVLGELSREQTPVVVAGSSGKSTVTSLLSHCLLHAGLDPSYFIGAIPYTPQTNAHIGTGDLFVLEGDEYPASNTDNRSKFLFLHPSHVLLTPLTHDHVNIFPTPREYLAPFHELIKLVPEDGSIIASTGGALSAEFLTTIPHAITYGVHEGMYHAADISWGAETSFNLMHENEEIATITTTQLGAHNIENIVGVAAFVFTHNLMSPEQFTAAIAAFRGLRRRLDKKTDNTRIPVYEGFGSSYEKARSAIEAMLQHFPDHNLKIIFEPHTFSWRNADALTWYDTVFAGAAHVYIYEPAAQGADTHKQLTQTDIINRVEQTGVSVSAITDPTTAVNQIKADTTETDVVLLLSSGNLGGLITAIPDMLDEAFPKS